MLMRAISSQMRFFVVILLVAAPVALAVRFSAQAADDVAASDGGFTVVLLPHVWGDSVGIDASLYTPVLGECLVLPVSIDGWCHN